MAGIYIHIPFCKSLCHYCDFYKTMGTARKQLVLDGLLREMELQRSFLPEKTIGTIYFGGGTPTVCAPAELSRLIAQVRSLWECMPPAEVTVEANPDDLVPGYAAALADAGVNRLSIGIQSFDEGMLSLMNRRHDGRGAVDAVRQAQREGFTNISADLIFGIPGETMQVLEKDIDRLLELRVQHVSAYHLTIEPMTVFGKKYQRNELTPVEEIQSERQYLLVHDKLTGAGYEHYEISNYALPGYRSRHNSAYWMGIPYLGIGPSAHSFDGRMRRWTVSSVEKYLEGLEGGTVYQCEFISPDDRYNEYVMLSLRCCEGLLLEELEQRFGRKKAEYFLTAAGNALNCGNLCCDEGRYYIPAERFLLSDRVIGDLFYVDIDA